MIGDVAIDNGMIKKTNRGILFMEEMQEVGIGIAPGRLNKDLNYLLIVLVFTKGFTPFREFAAVLC